MKKLGVILFLAGLAAVLAAGCGKDDAQPVVTRLYASESCGVAPLDVAFRADASGGVIGDPTGGNSFLKMRWDFGDGSVVTNTSSVAYHAYADPDTYQVTVTAEDDDGNISPPRSTVVVVVADSLAVTGFATFEGEPVDVVSSCQPILYSIRAKACDFEPDTGYYERFLYTWTFAEPGGTVISHDPRPVYRFSSDTSGLVNVQLRLEDPGRSITRRLTLPITVAPSEGTDVSLSGDWLDDTPVSPTIQIVARQEPIDLTLSLKVACSGPDPAYGLRVRGRLFVPNNLDIDLLDYVSPEGDDFAYSAVDSTEHVVRTFVWSIAQIEAGATHETQLHVRVPRVQINIIHDSYYVLEAYPCDSNPGNNNVRGRIQGIRP